jgi:hypothetical protein
MNQGLVMVMVGGGGGGCWVEVEVEVEVELSTGVGSFEGVVEDWRSANESLIVRRLVVGFLEA